TPDVVVEKEDGVKHLTGSDNKPEDVDTIFSDLENKEKENNILSPEEKKAAAQRKKDKQDVQLQSAIDVIKGIKVYRQFQK
ncbi:MAG: hypothetical protein KGK03_08195, partial [Candidatus Omnitrophica bacterium]|nr:hypothetical protein [Candidatus Omnitrophota bacterium]